MSVWAHDFLYCLRRLARAPGFTMTTVTLLAVALAANACVFSVVYCLLYKPLPFAQSDRLVMVVLHMSKENFDAPLPPEVIKNVAAQKQLFDTFGGAIRDYLFLQDDPETEPVGLATVFVEPELFGILGLRPAAGRLPSALDVRVHDPGNLLVSATFAANHFGSVPAALNQVLALKSGRYRIIGVMPVDAPFAASAQLWIPMSMSAEALKANPILFQRYAVGIGHLAPGVRALDAARRLTALLPEFPETKDYAEMSNVQVRAESLRHLWRQDSGDVVLRLMLGTVLLIMLITEINVCNLYIARLTSRQHESALLAALGVGPARLARLYLIEALIMSLAAAGIGLTLVPAGMKLLDHFGLMPFEAPYPIGVDRATIAFVALLAVATVAALSGSALWLQHRGGCVHEMLKQAGTRQTAGVRVRDARIVLTVAQVALTIALLFGSGLLMRSAHRLLTEDVGFNREGLVVTGLNLEADAATFGTAVRRLRDRAAALPGVTATTLSSSVPFAPSDGMMQRSYQPPGMATPEIGQWSIAWFFDNTEPNFFSVLGQPLIAGRPFTLDEARAEAPVAIVDATFAKRHFPGGMALGHSFRISLPDSDVYDPLNHGTVREMTIVGVAGPAYGAWMGADGHPAVYVPGLEGGQLLIRSSIDPLSLERSLKSIVHELSPRARLGVTAVMSDRLANLVRYRYRLNGLLELLGALTLSLAAVGLYAVLSFSVRMRMPEFGVRLALGADGSRLQRDVLVQGLRLAGFGALVGVPLAWFFSKVLHSQLYRIAPLDPVTLCGVAGIIAVVSVAASWLPARAAARVDPMSVLRAE